MESKFNVLKSEFESFEISDGFIRLNWSYITGSQKCKYRDGCSIHVDEQDILTLALTSVYCESSGNGLDILYSSRIPVAYKIQTMDKWSPFTNGWHKRKLEEYLGGKCND